MNETLQQELIKDLLLESHEGLDRFDSELLKLEQGQGGSDVMNTIFRVIHTIKGTAGCLGLGNIEKTAHAGENLLSLLRDGKLVITPAMITSLLALSDALRGMLRSLEASGTDGTADHSELLATLERLQTSPAPAAVEVAPVEENAAFGLFSDDDPLPVETEVAAIAPAPSPSVPTAPVKPQATVAEPPGGNAMESVGKSSVADNAIRVDIAQLDKVMNLVGELVLARNQIIANTTQFDQSALLTASQRLNIITTELQESVMKTRMQPIGNVWGKFPRIVRDVSHELGKRVRLTVFRRGCPARAGSHPVPGNDASAVGLGHGKRPDQSARPDRHRD